MRLTLDVIPLIGGLITLIFIIYFGRLRWETTHEGRNIMSTSVSFLFLAVGAGAGFELVEDIGWLALAVSMVYRIAIMMRAQREGRKLRKNFKTT